MNQKLKNVDPANPQVPYLYDTTEYCRATPPTTDANTAVVGIVQAVTPHGFRLAARNSDCGAGKAGFTWVAIGIHEE
jgi:hypothetical protein